MSEKRRRGQWKPNHFSYLHRPTEARQTLKSEIIYGIQYSGVATSWY